MNLKRELYVKALVPWFFNSMLFWNFIVLVAVILVIRDFPPTAVLCGWVLVTAMISLAMTMSITAIATNDGKVANLNYELQEHAAAGWKLMKYVNPIGALYAFFVLYAWRSILRPWFATMQHLSPSDTE